MWKWRAGILAKTRTGGRLAVARSGRDWLGLRMTLDDCNDYCATLPAAFHVVQWGDADVWKVGTETTFKVFAIGGLGAKDGPAVTFKVSEIGWEVLRDAAGCRPAPYLASRGMKWIQADLKGGLKAKELKQYLEASHALVAAGLPKKLQRELGLAGEV